MLNDFENKLEVLVYIITLMIILVNYGFRNHFMGIVDFKYFKPITDALVSGLPESLQY